MSSAPLKFLLLTESTQGGMMLRFVLRSTSKLQPLPWRAPVVVSRRMPLDVEDATYREHKRLYDGIQKRVPARTKNSAHVSAPGIR